jgi:lipopolysaccharide assembly outer membrane protein LptD (OstA)
VISFLLILLFSNSSESSEIVEYRGNKILFKVDSSLVCIYGEAEAEYGKLHVWADTLHYYLEDKFLDARGEVRFNDGSNIILAKRMTYDVEKKIGTAYKAKTEVENGWFYGEKIRYFEGKILKINNGYYTTCELDPPHYWFYSPNMRVNIGKDLVAEPVVLLVREIPLFVIPFYFQSLKKERSSGLITPSFGSSSHAGNYIEDIGWYQTLSPYADVTLSMDYYTQRGTKSHIGGRWKLFPYGDGTLYGSYIDERETNKKRWSLNLNNRSKLPGDINVNFYSDVASDNEYFSDYETGEVEKLIKDLSYGGNVSTRLFGTGIYGVLDYRENVSTGILRKKWPSINVTFPRMNFGMIHLRGASKYIRDETEHWGAGINGSADVGFNLLVFDLNTEFSSKGDYYEREDVFIKHWSSSFTIKTRLYGLSLFPLGPISKFRHIMTPSVSFRYAPEPDSFEVTSLPGFSRPSGRKSLGISLNNLFQCKIGEEKHDFASLSLSSSYRPKTDRFSAISISGNFWIGKLFKQTYSTSYDLYTEKLGNKYVTTKFGYGASFEGKPLNIDLSHRINFTQDKKIQQADVGVGMYVTPGWKVNLNTHYDFEERKITSSRLGLIRDLHCWELTMSFNTFGENWDYNIKLQIKNLQEVKLERSTIRTLLP